MPESAITQWPQHLAVVQTTLILYINDSEICTKYTSAIGIRKGVLQENFLPKQVSAHTVLGKFDSTTSLKCMLAKR